MAHSDLDAFFEPRSIAVVGASNDTRSVGYAVMRNLAKFKGELYAVNRKGGDIVGHPASESLTAIGKPVDMMCVAIPPKYIPALMDEAGACGVKAAVVISAGFGELGEEGLALQADMVARARSHNIRIVGPNCLGVIRPSTNLNASFAASQPPSGPIGVLSQSGALITGLISYAHGEQFGLSAALSLGAKADVGDTEALEWFAHDEETKSIAIYVEAFPNPHAVYKLACQITPQKPIVALKGGATAAGAKAASSHTGSLAGSLAAYSAAFAQSGILQAHSVSELMGWSRALAYQPPARGNRIAIVTNAGGPGVLSADEAGRHNLVLAELSADTHRRLNEVLPAVWSHNNPIDIIGDATPQRYRDALNIVGSAPEVDAVVVIMTVQAMTDPKETATAIVQAHDDPSWHKPLTSSFLGLVGTEVGAFLDARGVPEFNTPEQAISAIGALARRGAWLRRTETLPEVALDLPKPNIDLARKLVRDANQTNLDLAKARDVLAAAGIRYNRSGTAATAEAAVETARSIGYPVVIKLISPDVIHKSDVGGVVLGIADADGVKAACASIRERVEQHQPGARIDGFTIEEMVAGTEIIVGVSRDPEFGPLLMVGMGGVFVEVYKDVAFRLAPLTRRDALDMIDEIKAQPLLNGARERPVVNRDELAEILLRVSALITAAPEISELDLNPLVVTSRGLIAIDARVIAQPPGAKG